MDRKTRLIRLWQYLNIPHAVIEACSVEYDLLCPHCRLAGRGDVHVMLLPDDTGFKCGAAGHQYRSHARTNKHFSRPQGADHGHAQEDGSEITGRHCFAQG